MVRKLIYVDTSMWNRLHDQKVPAGDFLSRLSKSNSTLVVGDHAVHELAKTFESSRADTGDRAARLFGYLAEYLELGVPVIKPNFALMIEEALHIVGDAAAPEILLPEDKYAFLRARVTELASKKISASIRQEIQRRKQASLEHTQSLQTVLARETKLSVSLRNVRPDALKQWITNQSTLPIGIECLQIFLRSQFPQNPSAELWEVSRRLLDSPRFRVSRALTRTTLYSLWRCANYGSVPKDFNDDTLHLTNASYCDFFATTDTQHERERADVFDMSRLVQGSQIESLLEWLPGQVA